MTGDCHAHLGEFPACAGRRADDHEEADAVRQAWEMFCTHEGDGAYAGFLAALQTYRSALMTLAVKRMGVVR